MKKIILFSFVYKSHVNVTLKIAEELVKRDNNVIFYALPQFKDDITRIGATFRDYEVEFPINLQEVGMDIAKYGGKLMEFSQDILDKHIESLKDTDVDLIIHDYMASWGRFIARILNVKAASIIPSYVLTLETMNEFKKLIFKSTVMNMKYFNEIIKMSKINENISKKYNIDTGHVTEVLINKENLNVVTMLKDIQGRNEMLDSTFKFVGNITLKRKEQIEDSTLDELNNEEVIYVSLGSVSCNIDLYKKCLEAFRDSKYKVVMSIPDKDIIRELGEIPSNFIVKSNVNQLELLKKTTVFISHGGLNSVHEGIYNKVPMVLIPQIIEHMYICARCEKLGCGLKLNNKDVTAEVLKEMVQTVLNSKEIKSNIAALSSKMPENGITLAVDEILNYTQS